MINQDHFEGYLIAPGNTGSNVACAWRSTARARTGSPHPTTSRSGSTPPWNSTLGASRLATCCESAGTGAGRDIVEPLKLVVGNSHEGMGQAYVFSPHVRDHLPLLRFKVSKYC